MPPADHSRHNDPASFLAAQAALDAINQTLTDACADTEDRPPPRGPEPALAALLLLGEVRGQLAAWEGSLIETAREAGASWAALAEPLGVASRQAAERRYLRLRPGPDGTTGEQRIKAARDHRAADQAVTAWARDNAGELRQLAGQITALDDLPLSAHATVRSVALALADNDAAQLVAPLAEARPHVQDQHPHLGELLTRLTTHTERLREDSNHKRAGGAR